MSGLEKPVGELDIRKKHNINILAVKNEGGEIGVAISADTVAERWEYTSGTG